MTETANSISGAVKEVAHGLSGQPSCLAAVALAALMALLTYFALRDQSIRTHEVTMGILMQCPVERVKDDILP